MKEMNLDAGKHNSRGHAFTLPKNEGVNGTCFSETALMKFLSRLQSALKWPEGHTLAYNAWAEEWRDVLEFVAIPVGGKAVQFVRAECRAKMYDVLYVSGLDTRQFGGFHFTEVVHSLATFADDCDLSVITLLPECGDLRDGHAEPIGFYHCEDNSWEMILSAHPENEL